MSSNITKNSCIRYLMLQNIIKNNDIKCHKIYDVIRYKMS